MPLPGYQRVAVFGGVYNNYLALEALLDRCRVLEVDGIFCLGDIGGFGPFPDRCYPFPSKRRHSNHRRELRHFAG